MNNLETAVALATAPTSAYAELRERPRFWFPLLLVVLSAMSALAAGVVYLAVSSQQPAVNSQ